ncbi:hypothetical protein NON08_12925 [Cetobacterium somerae]|uniref:hypothetical protein n=1 Tax=Cetobacterium sp. NK01 TaxID=2993530 RepID=UPI002115FF91|nr:hypothetical protein [Cetobacterium sp. NK01]MCQ8213404.1 hypothetical protein [Cetobacterium sp. NK01]
MKKLLVLGVLILGTVTFSANGTGKLAGNSQPNKTTRMAANNGICVVTGTNERANKGESIGPGRAQNQTQGKGKMRGNGQGRMLNNQTANTTSSNTKVN